MPRTALDACVLTGRPAHAFLRRDWPALYEATPIPHATPFQSAGWLGAWAGALPVGAEPVVVLATGDGGNPAAALALEADIDATDGLPHVQPLSAPWAEYVRPVGAGAEDPAVVRALVHALSAHARAQGALVILTDLPETSALAQCLHAASGWRRAAVAHCAHVDLPLSMRALGMSPSSRRERRRRLRLWSELAASGRLSCHRTTTREELPAAGEVLARLYRRRWASAVLAEPVWPAMLDACGPQLATIGTLSLDGVPIAAQLLLYRGRHLYSLLSGWEPAWKSLSPGHALIQAIAGTPGYDVLDLGRTIPAQAGYKAAWGSRWSRTHTYTTAWGTP